MRYVCFLLIAFVSNSNVCAHALDSHKRKSLELLVTHYQSERSMVGISSGHLYQGQSHFYNFGETQVASKRLPTPSDYFEMGSITKTFTGTLLAREILLNRVTLKTTVADLWHELSALPVGSVTLEQLATHRSGLPRMPNNIVAHDPLNPYKDYTEKDLLEFMREFKFESSAPYEYEYSNLGVGLLGFLLAQKLNAISYESYLKRDLLEPLGINGVRTRLTLDELKNSAQGYDSLFFARPFWDLNALEGAGVLKITGTSMMKYLRFNLESARGEGRASDLLQDAARLAHLPRASLSKDEDGRIGLLWETHENFLGLKRAISHTGATGGYRASVVLAPDSNQGTFWFTNMTLGLPCYTATLVSAPCELPVWAEPTDAQMHTYEGNYFSDELNMTAKVFRSTRNLFAVQIVGQVQLRLWPQTDTKFLIQEADAMIEFFSDSDKKITHFTLDQRGAFVFKKQ